MSVTPGQTHGKPGAAVVLAAGLSTRMGRTKALLPYGGSTFLRTICGRLGAAGLSSLWVVLGPGSLRAACEVPESVPRERILFNPQPERGPLSSLQVALDALPAETPWLLVALVDHPAVRAETVRGLVDVADPARIVVPVYRGRRGHPVVFGSGVFDELRAAPESEGARVVVRRVPERVLERPCEDPGVLVDVDTPDEFAALAEPSPGTAPPGRPAGDDLFERMARDRREHVPFALCTVVSVERSAPREPGARMLVQEDGGIVGTVGGGPLEADVIRAAVEMLRKDEPPRKLTFQLDHYPEMRCGGAVEVFVDPVLPQPRVILVGAGHIGHQVARLCEVCRVPYVVADDRPELADPARFPGAARIVVCGLDAAPFAAIGVTRWDCIVLVSRTYDYDELCLAAALGTPARYVGMMGSARKVGGTIAKLESRGLKVRGDPRVRLPIGLDVGDRTPEHIALSILAEVLQVAYRKDGRPHSMLERNEP